MLCYKKTLILFVFLVFPVISNTAMAELWDYTVHVEKQAENFNEARASAIKDNREMALESVISRFIVLSNFRIVDKLIDADTAYFFEDKLRLSNETVTNNKYSVDVTYYFNKDKILAFLNKSGIPYTAKLENKVLIIPILDTAISNNNSWYKLWTSINNGDYLTNIVLLGNLTKVDTSKILTQDTNYLQQLKNTYKVDDVVLAKVTINNNDTNLNNNDSANTDKSAADNKDTNNSYNLKVTSVANNSYQEFDNLPSLYNALRYVIGFTEIDTKNKTISTLEQKNSIVFRAHYNSFVDWVAIYNHLKQIPQIEGIYINEIGDNYAIIKIKYHGELNDIIDGASSRNIIIDINELSITCKGFCY